MAKIPNSGFAMDSEPHRQQTSSDFVAVDIGKLPIVTKSLSRKGDDAALAINDVSLIWHKDDETVKNREFTGGAHASEKQAVSGHVAASDESVLLPRVSTLTAGVGGGGKYRRLGSSRRLASPWLDPRRVMFAFAVLSSMGTLILLYFTLSMGKMSGGDADAR